MTDLYTLIERRLAPHGLILRGGLRPPADADLPAVAGRPVATIVLVGNAGSVMWRAFAREPRPSAERHPLNRWVARTLNTVAAEFGAAVCFPHDGPPFRPFLSWARAADAVFPSPLGLFLHPEYGPWHAYRGALLFAEPVALPAPPTADPPCETCRDKPCLTACPVPALRGKVLHVAECVAHPDGAACRTQGCAARRACPVGTAYRYEPAHANFHIEAFLASGPAEGVPSSRA
jgi:hypothetical protein